MGEAAGEIRPELRGSRRTNLLLTAVAEFNGLSAQVRIRNVSETGALLEGAHLPAQGGRLWLKRADLQVAGTVAWTDAGKAGIQFDERVRIEFWSGGKPKPIELSGLRDQRRVDAIQQAVRAGLSTSAYEDHATSAADNKGQLNLRVAEEINYVARLMENFGDELASEPAILIKHAKGLQSIDLANQILTQLAQVIAADDPDASVAQIGMSDLRSRLTRKRLPGT